jgi:hypothetical protein
MSNNKEKIAAAANAGDAIVTKTVYIENALIRP